MKQKEKKIIAENLQTIKDVGNKGLAKKVKRKWDKNIKGAIAGGVIGIIAGLAMRKSPVVFGVIGLVLGRIIINKTK
jgi:uncharacterized membrane protein